MMTTNEQQPEPDVYMLSSVHTSESGTLIAMQLSDLPFIPRRAFVVSGVPVGATRGVHAHRVCHQYLVLVRGRVQVELSDGDQSEMVNLSLSGSGVLIPAMNWGSQTYLAPNSEVIVFASHHYDSEDYIHDFRDFIHEKGAPRDTS